MKKLFLIVTLILALLMPTAINAKPVHQCEFDYSVWHYHINMLRSENNLEPIEWNAILAEAAEEMYRLGGELPSNYRNTSAWARTFLNEANVFTANCISAKSIRNFGDEPEKIVARMSSTIVGARSFGRAVGYFEGDNHIILIFVR